MRSENPTPSERIEAKAIIERLRPHIHRLTPREAKFVDAVFERIGRYGFRTRVSVAQIGWLRDLHERHAE
jgi:hypothetical protein